MLNEDYKNVAIRDLENANAEYTQVFKQAIKNMENLLKTRRRAVQTICRIEGYIISLANKPRDYEQKIGEIKLRYIEFNNRIEEIEKLDASQTTMKTERGVGAGVAMGVGTAAFAPTAAMAVAMTFGTASTGTAIASLSGVAATNAALAWLGGGTLLAGGAGVAGGQALLTMAGPIGWAIGGISIAGGFLVKAIANKEIAKKAEDATKTILREMNRIKKTGATVSAWNKETITLTNELLKKLTVLRRKKDYRFFTEDDCHELIILMNMTEVLSKKIGDTIHEQ